MSTQLKTAIKDPLLDIRNAAGARPPACFRESPMPQPREYAAEAFRREPRWQVEPTTFPQSELKNAGDKNEDVHLSSDDGSDIGIEGGGRGGLCHRNREHRQRRRADTVSSLPCGLQ